MHIAIPTTRMRGMMVVIYCFLQLIAYNVKTYLSTSTFQLYCTGNINIIESILLANNLGKATTWYMLTLLSISSGYRCILRVRRRLLQWSRYAAGSYSTCTLANITYILTLFKPGFCPSRHFPSSYFYARKAAGICIVARAPIENVPPSANLPPMLDYHT